MPSTQDWSYERILTLFNSSGCTITGCPYRDVGGGTINSCALDLSDAVLRASYTLPIISDPYNKCPHTNPRVRGADIMARLARAQNNATVDASGWANRPPWKGIVFFEEPDPATSLTGHIDLWDGASGKGVHGTYPTWGGVIWFWKLGTSPNDLMLGTWRSNDTPSRWTLGFSDGACNWVERNASGGTITRKVFPHVVGGRYRLERPNDAEVLTFLGARPEVRDEILARSPGPSIVTINRTDGTASADWSGLFWTLDANGKLTSLSYKTKAYAFTKV